MRFCRFACEDGSEGLGVKSESGIVRLRDLGASLPTEMEALVALDGNVLAEKLAGLRQAPVLDQPYRLLAPISRPEKILCVGLNYRDHALETGKQPPSEPVIFSKLTSAIIAPDEPIVLPSLCERVDFEAELVVVIGKECRHVNEADAMERVFGYCCGHDVSSRDWQYEHSGGQWLLGKSFDTFAPLGPAIVHKSLVPDPGNLRIRMLVGDEVMQDSSTRELIFPIPMLVSYLSRIATLRPGDLLFTGTPSGVGAARKPPRFLRAGDRCTVEIEMLGSLSNPVEAEQE